MAIKKIEIRPKGNGDYSDVLYPKTSADMVETAGETNVQEEIDNLKSSVSSGKNSIATAITGKGVSASGSDTFGQLSTKIGQIIVPTGNAVAGDVLTGKTFSKAGSAGLTGTMPNRGAVTNTITIQGGSYTIPSGYHSGSGKVQATFANLVSGNVKSGVNIGGVVGNLQESKFASGTVTSVYNGSYTIEVTGLNFKPRMIIAFMDEGVSYGRYDISVYNADHSTTKCWITTGYDGDDDIRINASIGGSTGDPLYVVNGGFKLPIARMYNDFLFYWYARA